MNKNDIEQFDEALTASFELYGKDRPSNEAMKRWINALQNYSIEIILFALSKHESSSNFPPRPAGLIEIIHANDGRPTPDKAWAMFPKSEHETRVISDEMCQAWEVAREQYCNGDEIGAQIAFKREYTAIIQRARDLGIAPLWFASLGFNDDSRADALIEGVENRRISIYQALNLLPYDEKAKTKLIERADKAGLLSDEQKRDLLPNPIENLGMIGKRAI